MAGLFNILKVTVSEDKICAHVLVNPGMPLMTSEDIEATARVYYLVPAIAKHLCLGDSGREFQDCMGQTLSLIHICRAFCSRRIPSVALSTTCAMRTRLRTAA